MSENTNESENQTETSSEPTSSESSQASEKLESAQKAAGNLLTSLMQLKESNPKVFFGGIGAIAVVFLILIMSGGSDKNLPKHKAAALAPGQNYVLKNPNTYDTNATVRLVSVPGSMAAYDDTEEADREGACKHMPQNTPVKLIQSQRDATDKNVLWAEVEMLQGECQGQKGWTSAINLQ